MSIDAFRFLTTLLAQTSQPATRPADDVSSPLALLLLLAALLALPLTIRLIHHQQLHKGLLTLEPLQAPGTNDVLGLGAALLLGLALSMVVGGAMFHAMGGRALAPESPAEKRLAMQRLAILVQPAGQIATIVGALGMLVVLLPAGVRAIHLRFDRAATDLRHGVSGYLLALPWVLLVSVIVARIVQTWGIHTPTEHEVFTLWRAEGPGLTRFKLVMMAGAVILAPVSEELLFRGLLQTLILRVFRIPAVAIGLASLAFAAMHTPWPMRPPIFLLSLALGWTYFRSRSLLAAIFMHIVFNALQFVFFLSFA